MARPDADLVVIGAGAAGLSVAAGAAQLGLRTVLIERGQMGGECLNTGCVPSKALLAAAHAAIAAAEAGRFGLTPARLAVDWTSVRAHVRGVIAAIAPMDSRARFEGLGCRVIEGEARFAAADVIAVGAERIRARRIVVATGSRPAVPDIPGLAGAGYVTHETLFDLPEQPSHLLILGGGAIGLEMAQAHAGLGSRVTIVEQATIGGREDPELVAALRPGLTRLGVEILEHAKVARAEVGAEAGTGAALHLADGRRLSGSHLLVAAGRRPDFSALDLTAGRVAATARGITTDRGLRSVSNPRVFAVGDAADPAGIGPRYLTHAASHGAGVVIRRLVFRLPARLRPHLPRAIYTDPELAQTGLTEAEARAAGLNIRVLRAPLAENDRAQAERRPEGLAKLVIGRGGRILGAGIVAPHAGEMIGAWTLAISRGLRLGAMADLVLPYPTLAETPKRAASHALAEVLFAPRTKRLVGILRHAL